MPLGQKWQNGSQGKGPIKRKFLFLSTEKTTSCRKRHLSSLRQKPKPRDEMNFSRKQPPNPFNEIRGRKVARREKGLGSLDPTIYQGGLRFKRKQKKMRISSCQRWVESPEMQGRGVYDSEAVTKGGEGHQSVKGQSLGTGGLRPISTAKKRWGGGVSKFSEPERGELYCLKLKGGTF